MELSKIWTTRRVAAAVAAAAVVIAGAAVVTPPAGASDAPRALTGAVPDWASGTPLSTLGAGSTVDFVVQLAPRDQAALAQFAEDVNDPTSPSYHHYLTAAQYAATYGPSPAALATVEGVLKGAGLSIDTVTDRGSYLAVHGSAPAVGALFGTSFGTFSVGGLTLRAPLSTPTVPAALSGLVANVAGLAQSAPLRPDHRFDTATPAATPSSTPSTSPTTSPTTSPVFLNARPCSGYYGEKSATTVPTYEGQAQKYAVCGYTGATLRKAYGLAATGLTGKGVSIGIVDAYASSTILSDANTYATGHGEKAFATGQFTENVPVGVQQIPEDPIGILDPDGWAGEETLDVEAAHSMAPDANIVYQSGLTPYGPTLYLAIGALVEQGTVQIVSNSFGGATDDPLATDKALFDQITTEAAATGVTIAFSSGDDGDETDPSANGSRNADFPATSDGVVAVGGTTLEVDAAGTRTDETYWGTKKFLETSDGKAWDLSTYVYGGAGGGGVSTSYAEPAWQKGVVPDALATFGGVSAGRVVPDLSLLGDPTTGFLMGQTQKFPDSSVKYSEYRIGGTSLACPLFAGLLALAVERNGDKGLGLVTPALYAASASATGIAAVFNDPSDVVLDAQGNSTLANVRPDYTDGSDASTPVINSLRTLGNLATLHAFKGYDDSTGLGSPKAAALIAVLDGLPLPSDPTPPTTTPTDPTTTPPTTTPPATTPPTAPPPVTTPVTTPVPTTTTSPRLHVRLSRATAHRRSGRLVLHVQVQSTQDLAAGRFAVAVRVGGHRVGRLYVPGLAGHARTTVRLVVRDPGHDRRATVVLDPGNRLRQSDREGHKLSVRVH